MASSLVELLQPQYILRVISRIRTSQGPLGRWLGFHSDGFNEKNSAPESPNRGSSRGTQMVLQGDNIMRGDIRVVSYRIFDKTRVIAKARAPGAPPAEVAVNPIGQNQVTCPRFHQKISLNYEMLGNLSPVVGPNSQVDPGGEDYLMRQNEHLASTFNMAVEAMSAGMMRNSLYFVNIGDDWYVSFTPPTSTAGLWPANAIFLQIDFKIPATSTAQGAQALGTNPSAGPIIDQTWANTGALILTQIAAAKQAYAQLTGYPLTDIWMNSGLWPRVIANTELRNAAGAVNSPFSTYTQEGARDADGKYLENQYTLKLIADPTITWHITDDVLVQGQTDVDPTYATAPLGSTLVKLVPDGMAIFCNGGVKNWCQLYEGSEFVVENPGMPAVKRTGMHFWREYVTQPAVIDILGVLNAVPMLFIPKIIAPLQVVFP